MRCGLLRLARLLRPSLVRPRPLDYLSLAIDLPFLRTPKSLRRVQARGMASAQTGFHRLEAGQKMRSSRMSYSRGCRDSRQSMGANIDISGPRSNTLRLGPW